MTYKPKARLRNMRIDEVSLVDNPAHPDAEVVIAKRNDEERAAIRDEFNKHGTSHDQKDHGNWSSGGRGSGGSGKSKDKKPRKKKPKPGSGRFDPNHKYRNSGSAWDTPFSR